MEKNTLIYIIKNLKLDFEFFYLFLIPIILLSILIYQGIKRSNILKNLDKFNYYKLSKMRIFLIFSISFLMIFAFLKPRFQEYTFEKDRVGLSVFLFWMFLIV